MSKQNLVLMIVACALFMEQLDSTIMATALPQIAQSFHASAVSLSFTMAGYAVSLAMFIPISGWLSDRFGGSHVFRAAIVVFILSSVWCGVSTGMIELTIARVVQGIGGAMMVPVGRLVVLRTSAKTELVRAMAMIAMPGLIGPVLGAPVGGFITTYLSWRWNFFINVPLGVIGFILATLFIPDIREEHLRKLDFVGFLLITATLGLVMAGLDMFTEVGGHTSLALAVSAVGLVLGATYVRHAKHHPAPLLDLSLLKIQSFRICTTGSMGTRLATGATPYLLPLLFQVGFGYSALASGCLTFATALGMFSMRASAKPLLRRLGFRNVLVRNGIFSGLCIGICGFFTPNTPYLVIIAILLASGFFRSLGNSTINTLVYCDVDAPKMSTATSFAMMVNQLGNAFGVAMGAMLLHIFESMRGGTRLDVSDFRYSFIGVAVLAMASVPIFQALPKDAGDLLTGHRTSRSRDAAAEGKAKS